MHKSMNTYHQEKIPYLFIFDFDGLRPVIIPLKDAESENIFYDVNGVSNIPGHTVSKEELIFRKYQISFNAFTIAFEKVQQQLKAGNSYLVNLTFETPIEVNRSLWEIFLISKARYKLFYKDLFIVFSPESFITIHNGEIATFPMKGTIDASIENASEIILNDLKEMSEHATITDLLRNDLSMVADQVRVERYRYIDTLRTHEKTLLQVSSEIRGKLLPDMRDTPSGIFSRLLPAGSISGAPKKRTVEIIKEVESHDRGYYTGVFGYDNGTLIDSGVMIRFIEKREGKLYYKSGGGITIMSDARKEYEEMGDKVYLGVV
jgi:para-aminobenzoate synthetase component I